MLFYIDILQHTIFFDVNTKSLEVRLSIGHGFFLVALYLFYEYNHTIDLQSMKQIYIYQYQASNKKTNHLSHHLKQNLEKQKHILFVNNSLPSIHLSTLHLCI